jgi:DNA-binding Xre family transcriptional regulator
MMDQVLTMAALRALRRILRASDLSNRQLAAATGLTPSQLLILREIDERRETTPTALSSAVQFSQATITNICDRLEAAPDMLQARFSEGFSALPQWEQAMTLAGLERLVDVLGIAGRDAAPLLDSGAIDRASSDAT